MNKEKMLEAFGDIDPEYVREAKPSARPRYMRWVGTAAAAAVLVLGLAAVLPKLIGKPGANSAPTETEKIAGIGTVSPSPEDPAVTEDQNAGAAGANGLPNGGMYGGEPNGAYLGGAHIDDSMREELKALVENADIVAVACCEWTSGEDRPLYTLEEAIKGELPESFTVKNGVKAVEKAHYLLFLSGADATGEYGFIAAMISSTDTQNAVNMPAGFVEVDFFEVAALAAELAAN